MSEPTLGELREQVWARLQKARALAYPLPPGGHHPNFRGAADAAARLLDNLFTRQLLHPGARVLSYPDYVLRPLRQGLLKRGVDVIVPAKYYRKEKPRYRLLQSGVAPPTQAVSISGAERHGTPIDPPDPADIAWCAVACVAVGARGRVLSKGYGYRLPSAYRALPCLTLIHPLQQIAAELDTPLGVQVFATPENVTDLSAHPPGSR